MIPYTREAVATIRNAINSGQPVDHVRSSLGWSCSMFEAICRRHGIDVHPARAADEDWPVVLPKPPRTRSAPARIPARIQASRTGLVATPISLTLDRVAKLERIAAAWGTARYQAGGRIVSERVAKGDLSTIERNSRRHIGHCSETLAIGIEEGDWQALYFEIEGRPNRGTRASVGMLAKSIVVSFLDLCP